MVCSKELENNNCQIQYDLRGNFSSMTRRGLTGINTFGEVIWRYEYNIKDHLGNTRVTFADLDNSGIVTTLEILQQNHYYPFGANIEGLASGSAPNKYQYNGKEWNADFGLEWNDYGARFYDPWVSRWWSVDPMAEPQANYSSYAYTFNNPIAFNDPTGMLGQRGADGLTNNEWLDSSRPGSKESAEQIQRQNRADDWANKSSGIKVNLPTAFFVNEAGLSAEKLKNIILEAATIFAKNGYSGLSLTQVSSKEAKKHETTYPNQMFLAFIRERIVDGFVTYPGNSGPGPDGTILVYYESLKHELGFGYVSWINFNDTKIRLHKGDKNYAAGFVIAHELVHQMLHIRGSYLGHVGAPPVNIMEEGPKITIPRGPTAKLQQAETIPDIARQVLDPYYLNSKRQE